jgi:hypothetical protein
MAAFFFIALLFGLCFNYSLAMTRKGSWALQVKPQRIESLSTKMSLEESLTSIICFAQESGYKISNLDEMANRVVLEEPTSLWSYGFFFPVFISKQTNGYTSIEIGIISKAIQYGPVVGHSHRKCVQGIKSTLAEQRINVTLARYKAEE